MTADEADATASASPASKTDVIILGGGLGTRLAPVLPDRPKILAPVAGRPILDLQLDRLQQQGFRRVILALGHLADQVCDHVQAGVEDLEIITSIESVPLGTAGAIAHALSLVKSTPVVVMNGDSLIDANIADFIAWAGANAAGSALVAARANEASRYGVLRLAENGLVESFDEKPEDCEQAWVNAGIYWLDAKVLQTITSIGQGSLEHEVLSKLPIGLLTAYCCSERFIDIGTPESLSLAARWSTESAERFGDHRT